MQAPSAAVVAAPPAAAASAVLSFTAPLVGGGGAGPAAAAATAAHAASVSTAVAPSDAAETLQSFEIAYCIQPSPPDWSRIVKSEDHEPCFRALKELVQLHAVQNDAPRACIVSAVHGQDLRPSPASVASGVAAPPRLLYYELRAFGFQKFIGLSDLQRLKDIDRVLDAGYDPLAQSTDRSLTGAVVVCVSAIDYERARLESIRAVPQPLAPEAAAAPSGKRRRWSLNPFSWGRNNNGGSEK